MRHLRIVQAQLSGRNAFCGPLTGLSEPDEQAAFGFDAHRSCIGVGIEVASWHERSCAGRRSLSVRRRTDARPYRSYHQWLRRDRRGAAGDVERCAASKSGMRAPAPCAPAGDSTATGFCDLPGRRRCAECLAGARESEWLWNRMGLHERLPSSRRRLRAHSCTGHYAYLEPSGRGWRCDRGYLDVRDKCVAVKVPQNAYLDHDQSKGWRCDRDYRDINGACVAIRIPPNAHPIGSSYGSGWECNRGFRLTDAECVAVVVPAQAFLSQSGDNWECGRGFAKEGAACVAVQLPANAHLDYSGNDWACDDGFRKHRSRLSKKKSAIGRRSPARRAPSGPAPVRSAAGPGRP